MGFFKKIGEALRKTKNSISQKIESIFTKSELNEDFWYDLEDVLISSDMGYDTATDLIDRMKRSAKKDRIKKVEDLKDLLRETIQEVFDDIEMKKDDYPLAIMVVGVNGVGKTTSIGKLANYYKNQDKKVVVVAGDTFRAAATEQLEEWAKRSGVKIIGQGEGADPASVVFDGLAFAKAKKFDVVIIDTAGRLHNKTNLMSELEKINRVVEKNYQEFDFQKYIVLDATTGQNAVSQVREFNSCVDLDGIILTKLDGTAKGGIAVAIANEFNLGVKFIGTGEKIDDIEPFDSQTYANEIV